MVETGAKFRFSRRRYVWKATSVSPQPSVRLTVRNSNTMHPRCSLISTRNREGIRAGPRISLGERNYRTDIVGRDSSRSETIHEKRCDETFFQLGHLIIQRTALYLNIPREICTYTPRVLEHSTKHVSESRPVSCILMQPQPAVGTEWPRCISTTCRKVSRLGDKRLDSR